MLVDPQLRDYTPEQLEIIKEHKMTPYVRLSTGVYSSWQFGNEIEEYTPDSSFYYLSKDNTGPIVLDLTNIENINFVDFDNKFIGNAYGVCDTPEQVFEKYKIFIDSPDLYFAISFSLIKKDDQPEHGGWRWCKWGEYIGTKESKADYLFHEPEINSVVLYHIFWLKNHVPYKVD